MEQESLLAPIPAVPLAVVTDYGEVESGASHAHYVRIENGSEYLIKGPLFVKGHPTVAGNEWVAAELATALGLPVLDYRIVRLAGELFFASLWMQERSFAPGIDRHLFERCTNRDRGYDVVVFDTWLCNKDRHNENLVVRLPRRTGDPYVLILNDHSHLLVSPLEPLAPDGLFERLDASPEPYVSLPFVRESIVSRERLDQALRSVETLPEAVIQRAVRSTPESLLPQPYRDAYEHFLLERRRRLRRAFEGNLHVFPGIEA